MSAVCLWTADYHLSVYISPSTRYMHRSVWLKYMCFTQLHWNKVLGWCCWEYLLVNDHCTVCKQSNILLFSVCVELEKDPWFLLIQIFINQHFSYKENLVTMGQKPLFFLYLSQAQINKESCVKKGTHHKTTIKLYMHSARIAMVKDTIFICVADIHAAIWLLWRGWA